MRPKLSMEGFLVVFMATILPFLMAVSSRAQLGRALPYGLCILLTDGGRYMERT